MTKEAPSEEQGRGKRFEIYLLHRKGERRAHVGGKREQEE